MNAHLTSCSQLVTNLTASLKHSLQYRCPVSLVCMGSFNTSRQYEHFNPSWTSPSSCKQSLCPGIVVAMQLANYNICISFSLRMLNISSQHRFYTSALADWARFKIFKFVYVISRPFLVTFHQSRSTSRSTKTFPRGPQRKSQI